MKSQNHHFINFLFFLSLIWTRNKVSPKTGPSYILQQQFLLCGELNRNLENAHIAKDFMNFEPIDFSLPMN
jgi:hypothetical protein